MKRLVPVLCAAVLSACMSSYALPRARQPGPNPYGGRVEIMSPSSAVARLDYTVTSTNDHIFGDVFTLPGSASDRLYTLSLHTGGTGAEQLNAYFYLDSGGQPGNLCGHLDAHTDGHGGETGTICPGQTVGWAIVVLQTGVHATFTFSY